jgi:hypothetical protein
MTARKVVRRGMGEIDKRGKLDEAFFSYQQTKDGRVLLYWYDKHVKTLAGKEAQKFASRIEGLDGKEAQLVMGKFTGNFKRGNERRA